VTEPIAIVGMACRFPGAPSPQAYWELLCAGTDAVRQPPRGRPELRPPRWLVEQAPSSSRGGFLERLDQFEPSFFRVSPREAARMDPQQRLLLEVSWEALEDAGQPVTALSGTKTGVFVGIMNADFARRHAQDLAQIDAQLGPGSSLGIASNRLSFVLDLRGPSLSVDTLCSSSLVAVHLACQSLLDDESTPVALAGGVNVILDRTMDVFYARAQLLSADGQCRAFDARARGIVRGEGCGMLVLKRLSRAVADGDRLHALIAGSAVNQDGRSNGLTSPSRWSQEDVLRTAYRRADVAPSSVAFIEAHGTGTLIGDPIEAAALGAVVGAGRPPDRPCLLGSVKSNFGHLESAAGIAGLIKSVLALSHGTIPPSLHFESPNPYARLAERGLEVPTATRRLPRDGARTFAGVSSFGMGGTNAHVVLASTEVPVPRPTRAGAAAVLVPISAASVPALDALQARYAELLAAERVDLIDLAYTASVRRDHHDLRRAIVASSATDAAVRLKQPATYEGKVVPGQTHQIVFVHATPPRSDVAAAQIAFWRASGIEPAASLDATSGDLDPALVDDACGDDSTVFIEIGARSVVLDQLRAALERRARAGAAIASAAAGIDERTSLLHALAQLYCLGLDIDWRGLQLQGARLADLGTYPWQREHSWLDLPASPASAKPSRPSIISSLPEGILVPRWERASPPPPATQPARAWLIAGEAGETSSAVAATLAEAGQRVRMLGGDPPAERDHLAVHDVTGVVLMCTGDHDAHDPASVARRAHEDLSRAVRIAQTMTRSPDGRSPRLWIVTRGAQVVEDDTAIAPLSRATLWGFGRVVANEQPRLRCTLVDLPMPKRLSTRAFGEPANEQIDMLVAELLAGADDREIAYRGADRFVARLTRQELPARPTRLTLDDRAAYLVTGGLGGLGLAAAQRLVERGARRLVLVGRRGATSDEARRAVAELEASGARVAVEQADVTDGEAVAAIVARHPIRGIIHAAGVMTPAMLAAIAPDEIETALAAKVSGTLNLHEATASQRLDFFVMYSSVATLLGMPGQAIYGASNAYLDAVAELRRAHGLAALSVAWPVIEDTGMAAGAGARAMAQLADRGVASMPRHEATSILEQLIAWPQAPGHVGAVALDARKWTTFYPHAASSRLAPLTATTHGAVERAAPPPATVRATAVFAENLRTLARPARTNAIERWLCRVIASVMHEASEIDATSSLLALGIDSLTALELSTMVAEDLRVEVTTESLLRGPTVRELAAEIAQLITRELDGVSAPASAAPIVDLRANAELDRSLSFDAAPAGPPRSILLTGATGFLGAYLLAELLDQTTAHIHCLVRARDATDGFGRVESVLGRYGIPALDLASRVTCVPGDLAKPGLGLAPTDQRVLADALDTIVHCGASVNFVFPYEALAASNVGGTLEVLRLASAARARLHYVSTVGVFAGRDGEPVAETARSERPEQLPLGYMQAKWVAEELVDAARSRGLPTTVFRPGTIAGHAVNGAFNPDDFLCVLIKGCIQLGLAPATDVSVNLVPVDYVSRALVTLALTAERPAPSYHLVSRRATPWSDIVQWIRALGYPLVELPYAQWRRVVLERAHETGNALVPLLPLFSAHDTSDWLLLPPYDDALARRDLADTGISCPPIDAALFRRYIERFVVSGYLPRPP
jgi:thioester reductase-like protein